MIEILPIKLLRDEDTLIFGSLNVSLAKLERDGLSVASGVVVTPPNLHLKTVLEHFDFGSKEIFQQSLTLVKKELASTPIPQKLQEELKSHKEYFLNGKSQTDIKGVWMMLLEIWVEEIKHRLWKDGINHGITENLEPQVIVFPKKVKAFGLIFGEGEEITIEVKKGDLEPKDRKKLGEIAKAANKKLFIPHSYEWILDGDIKLTKVLQYVPGDPVEGAKRLRESTDVTTPLQHDSRLRTTVKVFFDLSTGFVVEPNADGIYIASEKIFDLNVPRDSFEELVFKIVEAATTFPQSPILVKLADMSEGMGSVRGTLRLIHQQSLLNPLIEALDFVRHKKMLTNVHIVIPFVRSPKELAQIKRDLSIKKLMRKSSLQQWIEIAVPENVINLEEYLINGVDGVVLNLDELIAHLNGFDHTQEELLFYKNEVNGLIKFLEDGLKLLHKSKVKFIATGSLSLYPQVLDFLVEKGVYGIVVEKYEAHSAHDLLHQSEKRLIRRRFA